MPQRFAIAVCLVAMCGTGLTAVRADDAPVLLTPAQAAAAMQLPDGFHAEVFAAEPDVQQPIAMSWDDRGRLWVAECLSYSERAINWDQNRHDRILIFEDADGDGRFDSRKVFWDEATRLTSICYGRGGVWALCAPHLLFIPDRDGDDVADGPPEIMLDGWHHGQGRHNIVNGLKWGPDGWLYGRQGNSANSSVGLPGAPAEERRQFNAAMWRFHPERHSFEVLCQGTTNPWGSDWNEVGEQFFINTVNGHLWHTLRGAHLERQNTIDPDPHVYELLTQHADHYHWDTGKGWADSRNVVGLTDQLGGGHAHCGMMIYQGDNWPAPWRGGLFTINLHGRRINHDRLEPHASGFIGRHEPDFMKSADIWFRAIDLDYGPDGAVYVIDWSDTGECHENDAVHRESGRIYRIVYGTIEPRPAADLAKLPDARLVSMLKHENEWYRRHVQRILAERNPSDETSAALRAAFETAENTRDRLRLLWTIHLATRAPIAFLQSQLAHADPHVRGWALRLLCDAGPMKKELVEHAVSLARTDAAPFVQLVCAETLDRISDAEREELAMALISRPVNAADHNIPLLVWYALEDLVAQDAGAAERLFLGSTSDKLRRFIARRVTHEMERDPAAVARLLQAGARQPALVQRDLLRGMSDGLKGRRKAAKPLGWDELSAHFAAAGEGAPALVRELGVVFGDGRALDEVRTLALDSRETITSRRTAVRQLVEAGPPDLPALLKRLVKDRATAGEAARGLAVIDSAESAGLVLEVYSRLIPEERALVIEQLCNRRNSALPLLLAVRDKRVDRDAITPANARQILAHHDDQLTKTLFDVWGAITTSPADKLEKIKSLKAALPPAELEQADLSQGRALFAKHCAACHKLYGEGGVNGPDLTGAGRQNLDYLLENIVEPSALVPADFRITTYALSDGRTVSGITLSTTTSTVTIQTTTEKLTLERDRIEESRLTNQSLMPDGLLDRLSPAEIRDLFGYLMTRRQVALPAK